MMTPHEKEFGKRKITKDNNTTHAKKVLKIPEREVKTRPFSSGWLNGSACAFQLTPPLYQTRILRGVSSASATFMAFIGMTVYFREVLRA